MAKNAAIVSQPCATADCDQVRQSLAYCRRVTKQRARNFYYGLKLTPEPKRSALYAVYAFMRACDDLADEATDSYGSQVALERIEQFRDRMRLAIEGPPDGDLPEGPVWPAFRYVCAAYPIDQTYLHAMIDGQKCDLQKNRYACFDELYQYCYKVAGVVGLVCLKVWSHDGGEAAEKLAEYRGVALQLTNILRDLVEDARRDRVYLPADELEHFRLDADTFMHQLLANEADERFDQLMAHQIDRTAHYYRQCEDLDRHISRDSRPTSLTIMRLYRNLFDKIRADPRRVLGERVSLSRWHKARIALSATWRPGMTWRSGS